MTEALAALIGVLVGGIIGSAFSFWSVRRAELERAVVAGWEVSHELSAILEHDRLQVQAARQGVLDLWRRNRGALVLYVAPETLDDIARGFLLLEVWTETDTHRTGLEHALALLSDRTRELREDHQAFILTPLFRYLRGRPWSRGADQDVRS